MRSFSLNDFSAAQESTKNEPDLSYLPNLRPAINIMHLMVTCINTILLPLAGPNLTIRREMEKRTAVAVNRMEEKTNSILQHTIDAVLSWTSKLLQSQKKSDFRPKDGVLDGGSGWVEQLQSPVSLPTSIAEQSCVVAPIAPTDHRHDEKRPASQSPPL